MAISAASRAPHCGRGLPEGEHLEGAEVVHDRQAHSGADGAGADHQSSQSNTAQPPEAEADAEQSRRDGEAEQRALRFGVDGGVVDRRAANVHRCGIDAALRGGDLRNLVDGSPQFVVVAQSGRREVHDHAGGARLVAQRAALGVAARRADEGAFQPLGRIAVGQPDVGIHELSHDLRAGDDAGKPLGSAGRAESSRRPLPAWPRRGEVSWRAARVAPRRRACSRPKSPGQTARRENGRETRTGPALRHSRRAATVRRRTNSIRAHGWRRWGRAPGEMRTPSRRSGSWAGPTSCERETMCWSSAWRPERRELCGAAVAARPKPFGQTMRATIGPQRPGG